MSSPAECDDDGDDDLMMMMMMSPDGERVRRAAAPTSAHLGGSSASCLAGPPHVPDSDRRRRRTASWLGGRGLPADPADICGHGLAVLVAAAVELDKTGAKPGTVSHAYTNARLHACTCVRACTLARTHKCAQVRKCTSRGMSRGCGRWWRGQRLAAITRLRKHLCLRTGASVQPVHGPVGGANGQYSPRHCRLYQASTLDACPSFFSTRLVLYGRKTRQREVLKVSKQHCVAPPRPLTWQGRHRCW